MSGELPESNADLGAPLGWHSERIEALVTYFTGGTAFLKSEYTATGTPVLTKGDVKPFCRIEHSGRFVSTAYAQQKRYRLTEPDDFLVTTRDLTTDANFLGLVSPVPPDRAYLVNQGANVFKLDHERVDRRYFVYWTSGQVYRNYIKGAFSGSKQIHIRKADWLNSPVWLPPRNYQEKVAGILGALDDKIELNRRMSQTLEAIAQTIFKSWFIDFDPIRHKASDEPDGAIAARIGVRAYLLPTLPDALEVFGGLELPVGWVVKGLDEIATYLNGLALQKYPATGEGSLPVIKIAQLRAGHSVGADRAGLDVSSSSRGWTGPTSASCPMRS